MNQRRLGLGLATALVAGNMIGSGIYLLPLTTAAIGSMTIISWIVTAAGALLLALVFARVAVLRLTPGFTLADTVRAEFGPFAAYMWSFVYWLSATSGCIAVALAAVGYFAWFVPRFAEPIWTLVGTVAALWLMTLANLYGARTVAKVSAGTLVIGLLPVLIVGIFGWWWFSADVFEASWNVSGVSMASALPASLVLVFWAFTGFESAAMASVTVANPARNVPIATVGGVAIAAIVYVAACTALSGMFSAAEMARQTAPFAAAVARGVGGIAGGLVAACALVKAAGTLGGWLLVAAETTRAGAHAGLFPRRLFDDLERPPRRALLFIAVGLSLLTLATAAPTIARQFAIIINVATLFCLFAYLGICCVLAKIGGTRDKVLAVAMFAFTAAVCAVSDPKLLAISVGIAAVGAVPWLLLRRQRAVVV
ncbi:amino acid permease [Glacieibacterium sp.]|uniref:amino acid permease n=1 Tax=Glacieibacterium sp. TaxID=2860237 RepID=UPI003B00F99B